MEKNAVYVLFSCKLLQKEHLTRMGANEIGRQSHLSDLCRSHPLVYNVALDWNSDNIKSVMRIKSLSRLEKVAADYYSVAGPDNKIHRILDFKKELLSVRGLWPGYQFYISGVSWEGFTFIPLEYAQEARMFALAPSGDSRQPQQIFLMKEGLMEQDELLQLSNAQQLFLYFWMGYFPGILADLKFVIQLPGETVYVPAHWSCARILLPGTKNYGFSGGK